MAEFRVVNWAPRELIGGDKMQQMNNNMTWLRDHTPRGHYSLPGGISRVEGLRIATGRAQISKRKSDTAMVQVSFHNLFSPGCQPIISTGIVSEGQVRVFCTIKGIGTLHPDNRGFQIMLNVAADLKKNDTIARTMFVHWQAMGY